MDSGYAIQLLKNEHMFSKKSKMLHVAEIGLKLKLPETLDISKHFNNKELKVLSDRQALIKSFPLQGFTTPSRKQSFSNYKRLQIFQMLHYNQLT